MHNYCILCCLCWKGKESEILKKWIELLQEGNKIEVDGKRSSWCMKDHRSWTCYHYHFYLSRLLFIESSCNLCRYSGSSKNFLWCACLCFHSYEPTLCGHVAKFYAVWWRIRCVHLRIQNYFLFIGFLSVFKDSFRCIILFGRNERVWGN